MKISIDSRRIREYWQNKEPYYKKSERNWPNEKPDSGNKLLYTLLLVGDLGKPSLDGNDPVLHMIRRQVESGNERMAIVFLGDNIYPRGLPAKTHRLREISELRLRAQLDLLTDFKGKVFFLSGNHDWNKGKSNGYEYLKRQEQYIEEYTGRGNIFLPDNGCPGPALVDLTDDLLLIILNTQWWIQRGLKPIGPYYKCQAKSEEAFFQLFEEAISRNTHRNIVIAGHHPLYSNALHGGHSTIKHHLFPLTAAHKHLYIPLPLAGSLYPLYRRFFGAYDDMSHPRYRRMRKGLLRILGKYRNLVYAAGHDHNLQYFNQDHNHFIVSGSGSQVSFVDRGGKAAFTHAQRGFFELNYYQNGEVWMNVLEPDTRQQEPIIAFRKRLV